jgi:hypothetical protein
VGNGHTASDLDYSGTSALALNSGTIRDAAGNDATMGLVLQAVSEELERAVVELAGARYERKAADQPLRRWGPQRGSVYLGDQKLPVEVPRVRNVDDDREISQAVYQTLQTPRNLDEGLSATDVERHCHTPSTRVVPRDLWSVISDGITSVREGHSAEAGPFLDGKSFAEEQIIMTWWIVGCSIKEFCQSSSTAPRDSTRW